MTSTNKCIDCSNFVNAQALTSNTDHFADCREHPPPPICPTEKEKPQEIDFREIFQNLKLTTTEPNDTRLGTLPFAVKMQILRYLNLQRQAAVAESEVEQRNSLSRLEIATMSPNQK